jgi:nucleotide-binding universal stress UspA family protein
MKILVAVDSSSYADEVLDEIAGRSWAKGTEFYVLTAIEPCRNWDAEQEFLHQGRIILDQRIISLKKRMTDHKITGQVLEGRAASVIVKTARELGAHLIIIGSHGDTGARMAGIGSVAATVVNEAPCSVEVVKLIKACAQKLSSGAEMEKLLK